MEPGLQGIYYANLVLANIDKVPAKSGYDLSCHEGETEFLRAYIYSNFVRGFRWCTYC
jgi:hypothetical protein